jgi:hypothetical protein
LRRTTTRSWPTALSAKAELLAAYDGLRLSNWTRAVHDPDYDAVTVTTTVKAYPGYDAADLQARVVAALALALSPKAWGTPPFTEDSQHPRWSNDPVVRRNKMIQVVEAVPGVNYVVDLVIVGAAGVVDASGDLTMPGTVALPTSGAHDVTVT